MRILLWYLSFVTLYHHVKCYYKFENFSKDFISSFHNVEKMFNKVTRAVSILFGKNTNKNLNMRVDARDQFSMFEHKEWERGAAKYLNASTKKQRAKIFDSYKLSTPLLAQWHGRQMETHIVQTKDGYFLTLHRIAAQPNVQKRTVLLHHGLLGSSMDWILMGPNSNTALPYLLADVGYDVWLVNARGNIYSRGHATLTVFMDEFWNFSFHEMGLIDLPAILDYMRQKNVSMPMDYVGHSMGSTALLVFLSSLPHYKRYLRVAVLIAPLAYMNNVSGPLKALTALPKAVLKSMGEGEFLPKRKVPSVLARKYCKGPISVCDNPLLFISDLQPKRKLNSSFVARLQDHVPAGGSVKTIMHYMQLIKSEKFHTFNDDSSEYDIQSIDIPLALISSSDDSLAPVEDVRKIYYFIQNPIDHFLIDNKNVSHIDFLWDKSVCPMVFHKTLKYLEMGLRWNVLNYNTHSTKIFLRSKLKSYISKLQRSVI